MASLADEHRKEFEKRGDYVIQCNRHWFAMCPEKWERLCERARVDGRDGPNVIIYQTESDAPRDHYVIPAAVVRPLLLEGTLATSSVDGKRRWNLTLKDGRLHVTHGSGTIDVTGYYAARLPIEELKDEASDTSPSRGVTRDSDAIGIGAGFGNPEQNWRVEQVAVACASKAYRREGWSVESVEQERCGFNLCCTRGSESAHVEVKGVAGRERKFVITAGELRRAQQDEHFVLALVTSALSEQPILERLAACEFLAQFSFEPVQYWAVALRAAR